MRSSYDSLLESDPEFQQRMDEVRIETKRASVILVVEARFPTLRETAEQRIVRLNKADELDMLTKMLAGAPDEKTAQWVLSTFAV
jgi:precorrin-3B methylase